jgi:hypothetical protein
LKVVLRGRDDSLPASTTHGNHPRAEERRLTMSLKKAIVGGVVAVAVAAVAAGSVLLTRSRPGGQQAAKKRK